jgi:hypothetical protein
LEVTLIRATVLTTFLSLSCFAQGVGDLLNRPPAGVDEAVRQRVTEFYKLQMDGKFRQAESYVCEASRDAYYDMDKTRWRSSEVLRTSYEDDFRTGKIVVVLGTTLNTLQGPIPANYPMTSVWKYQEGQWCYYIDPERAKNFQSPFGKMTPGPETRAAGTGGMPTLPNVEDIERQLREGVTIDRSKVTLRGYEPSGGRVLISNTLPGTVELELWHLPLEGFQAKLSRTDLAPGEKAMLEFDFKPTDRRLKPPLKVEIRVQPGGTVVPVEVEFTMPPEAIETIPERFRPKPQQ